MMKGLRWTPLALALCAAVSHAATADRVSTVTYDTRGLVASIDGPRTDVSDITKYTYDAQGRLATVTDALGHVTTYSAYDTYGNPGQVVDANGVVTSMTYTPEGWLATIVRDASGTPSTTSLTYDAVGNVVQTTDADGVVLHYTFDDASRLTDITDGAGNRIHYTLDAAGNRTNEETLDASGAVRRAVSRSFNSLSQLLTVTDALNRTVLSFDTTDGYDAEGKPVHSRDAKGVQRKQGYDSLGRLVSTINDYNGTNPSTANAQTVSQYDASDNVAGISDPSGLNTVYDHNGLGDLTGIHSPDTGTTLFTVDAAGNRITKTDANGIVTTYTYDALNRVTSATYADTSLNVAYFYDEANTVTGCSASAPVGHLTRVVENGVTTSYCYDARGNVTDKRQTQGAITDAMHYAYTPANRVQSETRPGGAVVAYARNSFGQVTGVSVTPASGVAQTVASNITWLPFGPMQAYTLGNGQTVTRTYDSNYRVTDIVSPALELHFSLDEMGDITGVSESGGGTAGYLYDPLYRLTSVKDAAGTAVEAYTYNPTGDRLSKTAPGAYTGTYKYKSGTHLLTNMGTATRTYDANGNTTGSSAAGTVWGYGYNGRNRMTAVTQNGTTVGTYVYNAMNERVAKSHGSATTRFIYDEASRLVSEASGSTRRDYIAVAGVPLAVADGASIGFITADGLGSPRAVTSSTGAVVWNWPYATNPFGENRPVSNAGYVLNLRLPGQYADGEAGLKYNVNRSFDAATGRYHESDPAGLAAGPSTYSYVNANPLGSADPLGLCPGETCDFSGSAPSPQEYERRGQGVGNVTYAPNPYGPGSLGNAGGTLYNLATLYQFKRGGPLDAQVQYGGSPAYANYVYGVYLGAAGWNLPEILSSADAYGKARSVYPSTTRMDDAYPHIPQANVKNITRGYNDQKTGNLCIVR
ncbi:RHS repeat protein [Luteibacter jiangsuensis]|uniref:RHS repeat protein n=1 Tax=Luteibacter jiangsuensis TaxID=637577 RepID=A0ABX0Q6A0_9GAMM|nr:RHS repeat domain-containing protein [Luteibacter jiangsuensis]NID05883.1 RHS repeat protein [Luteibacter jiangsuensis]